MFLMNPHIALVTFIIIIILYVCVSVRKPDVNWGSSTQAQAFVTALRASQALSKVQANPIRYFQLCSNSIDHTVCFQNLPNQTTLNQNKAN